MTAFANIPAAMVTALQAAPAVCAQVHRERVRPGAADWPELVVVRMQSAELEPLVIRGAPFNVDSRVRVELVARAAGGLSAEAALDALLGRVYARLAQDTTLGGLVGDLTPEGLSYEYDAAADPVGSVVITYRAVHQVDAGTLE